jgi:hypothetical protein
MGPRKGPWGILLPGLSRGSDPLIVYMMNIVQPN